jgi:hypothetical protein
VRELLSNGSFLRRREDLPALVLSQDYELFFQVSGSIEQCLFEPCDLLLAFAKEKGLRFTFFVDAGMLCCMQRLSANNAYMDRQLTKVKNHIESLVRADHEVGLHVHPRWEETVWKKDAWQFSGTRYQLRDFSDDEVAEIFRSNATVLNGLADGGVRSYRAGGFCVEPFGRIKNCLLEQGITIDSSVIPGAVLKDAEKGFDFSQAPDHGWWRFSASPAIPDNSGEFIEIAVTPLELPIFHYWGRLANRVTGHQPTGMIGDGISKAVGKREILRRLAGKGRISELSVDAPKAAQLLSRSIKHQNRDIWQIMGHPQLLGRGSLNVLSQFMDRMDIRRSVTVAGLAEAVSISERSQHCLCWDCTHNA